MDGLYGERDGMVFRLNLVCGRTGHALCCPDVHCCPVAHYFPVAHRPLDGDWNRIQTDLWCREDLQSGSTCLPRPGPHPQSCRLVSFSDPGASSDGPDYYGCYSHYRCYSSISSCKKIVRLVIPFNSVSRFIDLRPAFG